MTPSTTSERSAPSGMAASTGGRDAADGLVDQAHQRIGPDEDRRKHQRHQRDEDQRAPDLVRQHGVDAVAERGRVTVRAGGRRRRARGRPSRSGPSPRPRAPACRRRRATRGPLGVFAVRRSGVAVEQFAFEVAAAVEQQSFDEEAGQRLAASLR